jgi:hypothetical protein
MGAPGSLSGDGLALFVGGGLGCGAYISPMGDLYFELDDLDEDSTPTQDRSRRGQITALVLGVKHHPLLAELLPSRGDDAAPCGPCRGSGFVPDIPGVLCQTCRGLGWTSPTVFTDPNDAAAS